MFKTHNLSLAVAFALLFVSLSVAAAPGKAVGTVSVDGTTTTLTLATLSSAENLFDSKKTDTIVTLTDKPLGDTAAEDDIGLSMKARGGDLVVAMLRIDGDKLLKVGLMYKGLSGVVKLPGSWFQYTATGKGAGTLKLAKREFDGHSYACELEFSAAPAARPAKK